jgi:hypothetical protein
MDRQTTLAQVAEMILSASEAIDKCRETFSRFAESQSSSDDYHQAAKKGKLFEDELSEIASGLGMVVSHPPRRCRYDLLINGKTVQCKKLDYVYGTESRPSLLVLAKMAGREHSGYERGDWDVLAIKHRGETAIIPADSVLMSCGTRIKLHVPIDEFNKWIDRWDVFGESFTVPDSRHKQLGLFDIS